MAAPKYARQPVSSLLQSSFGFTLGLVIISYALDYIIQLSPPLKALASSVHTSLTSLYSTFYNHILTNYASNVDARAGFIIIVYCTQPLHTVLFWAHCLVLSLFDCFPQTFKWAHRWKIQNHDEPVETKKLVWTALTCLFNQVAVNGPLAYLTYSLTEKRMSFSPSDIPSFNTLITHLAAFAVVEEIGFYYGHRLMHVPWFYKKFHKQHHEWTSPVGFVAIYADPIEHITSNLLPVMAGPWLMGSHVLVYWLWLIVAVHVTIQVHSGYHFPLTPSSEFHDFHHLKFNVNYGVLGFLDWFHATDGLFYTSKFKHLSDRDRVFYSSAAAEEMPKQLEAVRATSAKKKP